MKILLIGINDAPEIISTAVYSTGLAEYFASAGHEVEVMTAQPYYPEWKVKDGWPKSGYKSEISETGVSVLHCPFSAGRADRQVADYSPSELRSNSYASLPMESLSPSA